MRATHDSSRDAVFLEPPSRYRLTMKSPDKLHATVEHSAMVMPIAYPLDDFYARAHLTLPQIKQVCGEQVPEPYRALLVHHDDMTPTLESFHKQTIHIRVLRSETREVYYFREVVLLLDGTGEPVEFGAIKINLSLFPSQARKLILEEHEPLGHILKSRGITHTSRPKAFFQIESDALINKALSVRTPTILYGRRNTISDAQQRPLAEIVEIIPPPRLWPV